MFTGIIKETGTVSSIKNMGQDIELSIDAGKITDSVETGDSISVNGVCLTVKSFDSGSLTFDVSLNTLRLSNLGRLKEGDTVNLEDSLSPGDKMGGHFVHGHVDAVSAITEINETGRSYEITFDLDSSIAPFITERGSVAVDGISLTVTGVTDNSFKTVIIPHTYNNTTLGKKGIGGTVNIEADMLARYIVNFLSRQEEGTDDLLEKDRVLKEKLEENGFIQ
jgi:riboflavin synthase